MKLIIAAKPNKQDSPHLHKLNIMSKERYEIREKIGQGGVGAVYKAFDTQLNREVAIKRLLTDAGDDESQISNSDATKSLFKEATALSALQHPHIVTVYDAGLDDDGAYVVMELIKGRTLDEMVERGTLTWDDLYEVALQTQEALIAAQDLDLVHRDLKPSNIMLCWLASGKFQIKIVDFGLAKFSAAPSLQTIDHGDAVFGSIFFMAPEQFERTPLDQRTDMYAMGCLYYYALTGQYPFNGETAPAVMASHLQHTITHLREVRPDIPTWAADWVMWHMERSMDDRPLNARKALEQLLMAKQGGAAAISSGIQTQPTGPTKFNFEASSNEALDQVATMEPTQAIAKIHSDTDPTSPVSIMAPGATKPSPHTQAQNAIKKTQATAPALTANPPGLNTQSSPQPSAVTTNTAKNSQLIVDKTPSAKGLNKLPQAAKISIIVALSLISIIFIAIFFSQSGSRKEIKAYNSAIEKAQTQQEENKQNDDLSLTGLSLTLPEINAILNKSTGIEDNQERHTLRKVLSYAQGDGFDADPVIVEFITKSAMRDNLRIDLLKLVMAKRKNPDNIEHLLDFAKTTTDTESAVAAINAAKANIDPDNPQQYFASFLDIINNSAEINVINASEQAASTIVTNTKNKDALNPLIINSYESATNKNEKYAFLRLLGSTGTDKAGEALIKSLNSNDDTLTGAAISALSKWPNASLFDDLANYIRTTDNKQLQDNAFSAAYNMMSLKDVEYTPTQLRENIITLSEIASTQRQKLKVIYNCISIKKAWSDDILLEYVEGDDKDISSQAKKALDQKLKTKKSGKLKKQP